MLTNIRNVIAYVIAAAFLILPPASCTKTQGQSRPSLDELIRRLQSTEVTPTTRVQILIAIGELKEDAKEAVPYLLRIIKDSTEDPSVRDQARITLEEVGPSAVPGLISVVVDAAGVDAPGRHRACIALGALDKNATDAIAPLAKILAEEGEDISVRRCAADSIGEISGGSGQAVTALIAALRSRDVPLRARSAFALGQFGGAAKPALPSLITALSDVNSDAGVRMNAAHALGNIGVRDDEVMRQLTHTAKNDPAPHVRSAATASLKKLEGPPLWERLLALPNEYPFLRLIIPLAAVYLLYWAAVATLFWLAPLSLLWANEKLPSVRYIPLPWASGVKLPTRYLFAVGVFHHHPRVLDAWVKKRIGVARKLFAQTRVAQEHEVYVPISVDLGEGTPPSHFAPAALSSFFQREVSHLLIAGDGGVGKTNLAVELCRRAMDEDICARLCRSHLMIPVLLEESKEQGSKQAPTLLHRIQFLLHLLAPSADKPSAEFVRHLLKHRRVLPVIDSFSEMNPETRADVVRTIYGGPFNAVIITSRTREGLGDIQPKVITPQKLVRSNLNLFVQSYLEQRGKLQIIEGTKEFQRACLTLASMVDKGAVTVLIAKLFADQLIADNERALVGAPPVEFPQTVPDLMISSIKRLNRHGPGGHLHSQVVIAAAQAIAWRCVGETLSPRSISYQSAIEALRDNAVAAEMRSVGIKDSSNDDATLRSVLEHLNQGLNILTVTETHPAQVRFTLDPLSEYLAAMYLLDMLGSDRKAWRGFISKAGKLGEKEFVLALRDCCLSKGAHFDTPEFVVQDLNALIKGIEDAEKTPPIDQG